MVVSYPALMTLLTLSYLVFLTKLLCPAIYMVVCCPALMTLLMLSCLVFLTKLLHPATCLYAALTTLLTLSVDYLQEGCGEDFTNPATTLTLQQKAAVLVTPGVNKWDLLLGLCGGAALPAIVSKADY